MKKSSDDFYKNEDGSFLVDEGGIRVRKPQPPTNKSSAKAERGRAEGRMRTAAKRNALATIRNRKKSQIPASPTR